MRLHYFLDLPKLERKGGDIICTLNNIPKWYRYDKTKIKNTYKTFLKDYILEEPSKCYDSLTIHYRILRHNKRKLDKDNTIFVLKWLSDSLEELGYIKDDNVVNFISYDTIYNTKRPETMLEVIITDEKKEWSEI